MARYKVLKGVAHDVAASFVSSRNYGYDGHVMSMLLEHARSTELNSLSLDILTAEWTPNVPSAVQGSTHGVRRALEVFVRAYRTSEELIHSASLEVRFDLTEEQRFEWRGPVETPYQCQVDLVDDRGKRWRNAVEGWWSMASHKPPRPKLFLNTSTSFLSRLWRALTG